MSSSSLRRSRFRVQVPDEAPIARAAAEAVSRSRSSTEGSTGPGEYDADLESMTGKGIKRLCSELLELKKASDEDFQRNVYSNYSAFVRIFEEIGGVESEIMELKKHASTQAKLIQTLMNNFYSDMFADGLEETTVEDLSLSLPNKFGIHVQDALVTLDILLSEFRLKEALSLLEKETLNLQKLQIKEGRSSPIIISYTYALSERRTRLADQLASMAEHRRVSQPELQKALSGLCRLGENHRANSLLIKFYRSRLQEKVHELQRSNPCIYGTHIREQAKVVFSAISQAARYFATLYGETSPYSSELILWAREETEIFGHNFYKYVKSISETNGGLSLAAEAAISAVSLCSLLKSQRIVLLSNLLESVRPCMEEVLQMHVDHFKKVVHIFTTTENWTVGKYLSLGILRDTPSLSGIGDKVEYCLLTSSGRKFVTLMQAIVDDISPLVILGMGTSILKGLADLFSEYVCALERAIPSRVNAVESDSPEVSLAQTLPQQLSLLANASTLVHLFPSISGSICKGIKSSNDHLLLEQTEIFSQNELDDWMLSIEEAAYQLQGFFCQQFVSRLMSCGDFESTTHLGNWFIPSSSQDPAPSFAFQALFVRLRQLEQLSKSIFVGEDGLMGKLLKEIVETVISWLSDNQELWTKTVELSCIGHCSCLEQVYLDMHFLVEIAILGGYCSSDLIVAAIDLTEEMEVAFTETGSGPNGVAPDGVWATDAAKLAIKMLLEAESADREPELEQVATSLKDSRTQDWEDECLSVDSVDGSEGSTVLLDAKSEKMVHDDVRRFIVPKSFERQTSDDISDDYDDDGSRSPTVPYSDREDGEDAEKVDTGSGGLSEGEDTVELELERLTIKSEGQSIGSLNYFDAFAAQPIADELEVALGKDELKVSFGKENLVLENELENSMSRGRKDREEVVAELHTTNPEGESVGSLDESTIAAKLTIDEKKDISGEEILAVKTDLEPGWIKEIEGTRELVYEEPIAYPKMEPFGNIQESDAIGSQPATDELLDLAQSENLLLEAELLHTDRLIEVEGTQGQGVGERTTYPEVKTVDKLDEYKLGGNDYSVTMLEELVHDEGSKVKDKPVVVEPLNIEDGDGVLSEIFSEMILETSLQNPIGDGIILVEGSGSNFSGSAKQRGVRKRFKAAVRSLGKNGKVSIGSNSRISYEDKRRSDGLVESPKFFQEKKLAVLGDDATPFTMPEELVEVDNYQVDGESALLEPQSIGLGDELPSENFSSLILAESIGKTSEGSAGQKDVRRQFKRHSSRKNDKGSNDSGLKILLEVNSPSEVLVESTKLDSERERAKLEGHTSPFSLSHKYVQVDRSELDGEPIMLESPSIVYGDGLLSDNFSEMAPPTSLKNLGDGVTPIEGSVITSCNSAEQRGVKKQFRSPAPSLGKNRKISNASDLNISSEVINTSEVPVSSTKLDPMKELVKLEGAISPQIPVQAVRSELEGEPVILYDKPLSGNLSQLILATIPQNHSEDGVIHVEASGTPSDSSIGQRALIKQRSLTAAPGLGRNGKGSNDIDSKISSEVHNPADVLVKSTRLDLEKKTVMVEENISPSSMLKELVQGDESKVDGDAGLLEHQNIMGDSKLLSSSSSDLAVERSVRKLLSSSSSDLAVERSVRKQGKYIDGLIEDSKSISSKSLLHDSGGEQSRAISAAEKNGKSLDNSGVKTSSEAKKSSADQVNSGNLGTQEKIVLLEADDSLFIKSEEHAQVDSFNVQADDSISEGECTEHKPLRIGEGEKLQSVKFSELALETGLQKQGLDSSNPVGSSGNTLGDPARQRSGRKRTKSVSEENLGKSRKGAKALRPRWQ